MNTDNLPLDIREDFVLSMGDMTIGAMTPIEVTRKYTTWHLGSGEWADWIIRAFLSSVRGENNKLPIKAIACVDLEECIQELQEVEREGNFELPYPHTTIAVLEALGFVVDLQTGQVAIEGG